MRGTARLEFDTDVFCSDLEGEESLDRPGSASVCSRRRRVEVGADDL